MSLHDPILAVHVTAGSLGLILGPVAMTAPKRRGRHTNAGQAYHAAMAAVCVSAAGLAALDPARLWWFFPLALFSYGNAAYGIRAQRRREPGWLQKHIAGMGGSYIALTTALLVVNFGAWWTWVLPTAAGTLLIRRRANLSRA